MSKAKTKRVSLAAKMQTLILEGHRMQFLTREQTIDRFKSGKMYRTSIEEIEEFFDRGLCYCLWDVPDCDGKHTCDFISVAQFNTVHGFITDVVWLLRDDFTEQEK